MPYSITVLNYNFVLIKSFIKINIIRTQEKINSHIYETKENKNVCRLWQTEDGVSDRSGGLAFYRLQRFRYNRYTRIFEGLSLRRMRRVSCYQSALQSKLCSPG